MSTEKKKLAQKRNFLKFQLLGRSLSMHQEVITDEEKEIAKEITRLQNTLLTNFDKNSKTLGINVYEGPKCWCGKRAKYNEKSLYTPYEVSYICKKCKEHKNED